MRRLHGVLVGCAAITAYFSTAYLLKITYDPVVIAPAVAGRMVRLYGPFGELGISKFAALAPDHWLGSVADSDSDRRRSPVTVYENDKPLGPLHSTPA